MRNCQPLFLPVNFVSLIQLGVSFLTCLVLFCLLRTIKPRQFACDSFTPKYVIIGVVTIGKNKCVRVYFHHVFVDVHEVFISFRDKSRTLSSVDTRRVQALSAISRLFGVKCCELS